MVPTSLDDPVNRAKAIQTAVSLGLYIISLPLPCLSGAEPLSGWFCLILGLVIPAWWANVLLCLAIIFAWDDKPKLSACIATAALLLGFTTFNPELGIKAYDPGPGFFCWMGSIAVWVSNFWFKRFVASGKPDKANYLRKLQK